MDRIKEKLSAVGDAIREKTGKNDLLSLDEMPSKIAAIETGIKTDDATAVASDILNGKTAYVKDVKVTGTFSLDTELNTQDDLISQIQSVINELPDVSDLEPVLQEKAVTPTTSSQNVVADSGFDGLSKVIVNGDANLKAENIAEGVSIFGVTGTHSGGSSGGIEYEIVNLTQEGTSIPFTLKRVTSTFGMMTTSGQGGLPTKNAAHYNLSGMSAVYMGSVSSFLRNLFFEEGVLTSGSNFIAPYMAVFINDPSAEAIYEE